MFKAVGCADSASLRTLAKIFIGMGNDPAALLCLDHVFSSPPNLRKIPLAEVQASLSLYLDYIHLLNKLRPNKSSAEGLNRQRLFGFKVLGRNRYLVSKHTLLHGKLSSRFDPSGKSMDGYECGYDEIRQGIVQFISSRIDYRTETLDNACRELRGFSPCLSLLVQKDCSPQKGMGSCPFQHIQPEKLTVDRYHARLRLILLQFQILDSARCENLDTKKYVLTQRVRNAWALIECEVTGLGYCIPHFTRLLGGSDRSQISTLTVYLRELMDSGLCENGLRMSVANSNTTMTLRDSARTASGNTSWLHAPWLSTSIEKMPGRLSRVCRCTSRKGHRCGRNPCLGRGVSSWRISSGLSRLKLVAC